jgi:hypothetical protein
MPWAVLVLLLAPHTAPDTAGRRLRGEAHAIGSRVREPNRKHNSAVGRLDERAFRERAAAVARELAGDLRDPTLLPRHKSDALQGLQQIGPLAAGVAPTLVAVLHDHDVAEDRNARVAFFCGVTRAMAKVAPSDPAVIRALAGALLREPTGGGTCHRCTCALEALAAAGPAAQEIAGPVLERFARERSRVPHSRLEQAIDATGAAASMVPSLLARAGNRGVSIDDRAASLRTLAKSHDQLGPAERDAVRVAAEGFLFDEFVDVRVAAAELLGHSGLPALGHLARGLDDPQYRVRAAAARSLARLGPGAAPVRGRLIAVLDPFQGTGEAAAEALVAMGRIAQADVEAAARTAPRHVRPLVEATARAIQSSSMAPVRTALSTAYRRIGDGYADVEVLEPGEGKEYRAQGFRIRARIRGGVYTPGGTPPPAVDYTLTVDDAPNALFAALAGRRDGDRLRVRLSPETIPDPYASFPTPRPSSVAQFPVGSGADFDVEITRVCEPVVWTLFRGSGSVGKLAFETHCR